MVKARQDDWNYGSGTTPFDEYLAASADDDVPATVCIRHGRHVPCRTGQRFDQRYPAADDCLLSSHPAVVGLVDGYQRDTDGIRWDFEHVVKSWLYMQKGEGNW
jgi:hypothetical protein